MALKKKPGYTPSVLKNVFFQGISGIIGKVGGLVFTILIARTLFPELFGIYSLALTIILTIITFSDIGVGQTITRYVADSLGKKKNSKKEARSRFLFLIKIKIILAFIFALALFLLANPIANLFNKAALVVPLQIGSIYLFIGALYTAIGPTFLGIQKVKHSSIAETIFQISRVILIFIFLYYYKTVSVAFIVLAIAAAIALIYSLFIVIKKYRYLITGRQEQVERKRMFIFSAFLALSSLSSIFFTNIDKFMLGYYLPAEFLGYYTTIITIIGGALALTSFGVVVFPVFTQLKGLRLKKAVKRTFRYLTLVAVPATIGLTYLMVPSIQILYGAAYVPPEMKIPLILTGIFLSFLVFEAIISGLYATLFNAKEKPKFPALSMIIASVINIVLNIVFIFYFIKISPGYGLIGAGLATFISRYINLGILYFTARKKFKIRSGKAALLKPILASLVMLGFLFLFGYLFPLTILSWIIMLILAVAVYIGFMILIKGLDQKDFKLLKLILKK